MEPGDVGWLFAIACALVGLTTCGVVKEYGQWNAYANCLAHHTVDECKGAKP